MVVIGAFDGYGAGAVSRNLIVAESFAISTFGGFAKIFISDFACVRVAITPGAGLIFAESIFGTGFVLALGLTAFALVALGNAERNAGIGIGRAAVLTVPVTLAGIKAVSTGNVFFAVAAVAGRHRRLARSLEFFFADKSRTGVAAMSELIRQRAVVIGVNHPTGRAGGNIGLILFQAGVFQIELAFFVHFLAVEAFVKQLGRWLAFGEDIIV